MIRVAVFTLFLTLWMGDFAVDHSILINPVVRIENWNGSESIAVSVHETPLEIRQYRSYLKSDGDLLVFLHATLYGSSE